MIVNLATMHPAYVTGVQALYAIVVILGANVFLTPNLYWTIIETAVTLFTLSFVTVWMYSAAALAAPGGTQNLMLPRVAAAVLIVCGIGISALVILDRHGDVAGLESHSGVTTVMLTYGIAHLVLAWSAASLLTKSELRQGKASSTFVTFLQVVYLAIGVWWLRPRLLVVRHASLTHVG